MTISQRRDRAVTKRKTKKKALVGLFGEPGRKGTEWFVFAEDNSKRVGKGEDALDLATKAVRSLAKDGVPAGKSAHDRRLRACMLEVAVEGERARMWRQSLTPKQRDELDALFDKLDAHTRKIGVIGGGIR